MMPAKKRRATKKTTWESKPSQEFDAWFDDVLSEADKEHVTAAVLYLEQEGPSARMPMSYPIKQPNQCGMKELRPASVGHSELRILYAFDRQRMAVLLLGGDKAGNWNAWYDENVPAADAIFKREAAAVEVETRPPGSKTQKTKTNGRKR
jgi:hypothetical protein